MITAVIDIGSNSIKMLVAEGENAEPIFSSLSETRLSPNAESSSERIPETAFLAGVEAVAQMFREAEKFSPKKIAIVGTSLCRTAENASEFAAAIFRATGTPLRILSGEEEAELVAAGIATDTAIKMPCAIFDLGGGSLEFIAKKSRNGGNAFEKSWKLGAVRLMRKFFANPKEKIPKTEILALRKFVRETVEKTLCEQIPDGVNAVFCGGAAQVCKTLSQVSENEIFSEIFDQQLATLCEKTLQERVEMGVPAARADIFPAALAVFSEICAIGNFSSVFYTQRNLRFGLCSRLATNAFPPKV